MFIDFEPFREALANNNIYSSMELCESLLNDTGVAVLPGVAFGCRPEKLTLRLAFVDFDGAKALAAADQYATDTPLPDDFAYNYCFNCITAMDLMCDWINSLSHAADKIKMQGSL